LGHPENGRANLLSPARDPMHEKIRTN